MGATSRIIVVLLMIAVAVTKAGLPIDGAGYSMHNTGFSTDLVRFSIYFTL